MQDTIGDETMIARTDGGSSVDECALGRDGLPPEADFSDGTTVADREPFLAALKRSERISQLADDIEQGNAVVGSQSEVREAIAEAEKPRKWTSEAGPRQTKQVDEALGKITTEFSMHTELTGVIGGEERSMSFYVCFGSNNRPDIVEALKKIGEQFDYTITRKNYQDIIAACAAALPAIKAARPIVDKRKTPEQVQEDEALRLWHQREREAKERIQKEGAAIQERKLREQYPWAMPADCGLSSYARAAANLKTELSQAFPGVRFSVKSSSASMTNSIHYEWELGPTSQAVGEIAGKYHYGRFDGMIDMESSDQSAFGEAVEQVLGRAKWIDGRRNIPEAINERVARLLCEAQQVEYKGLRETQNVFGQGDTQRLWDHVNKIISQTTFPFGAEIIGIEWSQGGKDEFTDAEIPQGYYLQFSEVETPVVVAPAVPASAGGITVRENIPKNGIEVKFASKDAALPYIAQLKAHGFHWSKFQKLWYARRSETVIAFAYSLVDKVAA